MFLKSISIKGFKSFVDETATFKDGFNCIIGQNG